MYRIIIIIIIMITDCYESLSRITGYTKPRDIVSVYEHLLLKCNNEISIQKRNFVR